MIIKPPPVYGRRMPFGRHKSLLIEQVVLRYPDYVHWLSQRTPYEAFAWVQEYIDDCAELLDSLPFTGTTCAGKLAGVPCGRPATRFSLRQGSATPYFWCADCDPQQLGGGTMLRVKNRYYDALYHVWASTDHPRKLYRDVVRQLAKAKGYRGSFTEEKIVGFLYGSDAKRICARLDND